MRHKYITVSFYKLPKFSFLGFNQRYDPNYETFERLLLKHIFARVLFFAFGDKMPEKEVLQRVKEIIDNCHYGTYNRGTKRHLTFDMNPDFDMDLVPFTNNDMVDCELGLFSIGDTFRDVDKEIEDHHVLLQTEGKAKIDLKKVTHGVRIVFHNHGDYCRSYPKYVDLLELVLFMVMSKEEALKLKDCLHGTQCIARNAIRIEVEYYFSDNPDLSKLIVTDTIIKSDYAISIEVQKI